MGRTLGRGAALGLGPETEGRRPLLAKATAEVTTEHGIGVVLNCPRGAVLRAGSGAGLTGPTTHRPSSAHGPSEGGASSGRLTRRRHFYGLAEANATERGGLRPREGGP